MYYCTSNYFESRQDHFVCANYRSSTGSCSAHFIRAVVLDELDRLFLRLYEDNVAGRISDESSAMMSGAYENEQAKLK